MCIAGILHTAVCKIPGALLWYCYSKSYVCPSVRPFVCLSVTMMYRGRMCCPDRSKNENIYLFIFYLFLEPNRAYTQFPRAANIQKEMKHVWKGHGADSEIGNVSATGRIHGRLPQSSGRRPEMMRKTFL